MPFFRAMRLGDYPRVVELLRQIGTREFPLLPRETLEDFMELKTFQPFVVENDDELVVTFGLLNVLPNPKFGWRGYIDYIVTDEPYRRRGFGRILFQGLIRRAQHLGCHHILLTTSDKKARRLYRSCGFIVRPKSRPMKLTL
jgi:GNAT superfamily N-acetyltransferase